MPDNTFFEESTEQSLVKAVIVSKYFWAWAKVIMSTVKNNGGKIAYIDLFAGPGRYKDGTTSTPLMILERAIKDPDMRQMLVTIFNDRDANNSQSLQKAIAELPGIDTLKYAPRIYTSEVGEQLVRMFEQARLVPTLFFVDPWGYKGLSLRLVNAVLKDWGCDCIFFFNYNRINMGLGNEAVQEHMDALFGQERAATLRIKLAALQSHERESAIVEEISRALMGMGGKYVLPFCFKNDRGSRTSHHLIFVSKNFMGYKIMKEIMAGESSGREQGVSSFEYCPASRLQPLLFGLSQPLDDLEQQLLTHFAGRTVTMQQVYMEHNVNTPYIAKNYKDVLLKLELAGKITASPSASHRKKGTTTFADNVQVTFPTLN